MAVVVAAAAVVVRMGITMLEIMVNMKHVVDIMKLLFMTMVATILPTTLLKGVWLPGTLKVYFPWFSRP